MIFKSLNHILCRILKKILHLEMWNLSSLIESTLSNHKLSEVKLYSSLLLRCYRLNENKKQVKFHRFLHSQCQLYLYSKNTSSNLAENILRNYSKVQKYFVLEIKMNKRWGRWRFGFKRLCHFFPSHPPTTYHLKGKRVVFFLNMSLNEWEI